MHALRTRIGKTRIGNVIQDFENFQRLEYASETLKADRGGKHYFNHLIDDLNDGSSQNHVRGPNYV